MPYRVYRVDFPDAPSIFVVATDPEAVATNVNVQGASKIERVHVTVVVIPEEP